MNIFRVATLTLAGSAFLLITSSAFAFSLPGQAVNRPFGPGYGASQAGNPRQNAQTRLLDAKLRACQARENAIKQRSTRLTQLVATMESKFDAIAKRVEDYYNSKIVPSGKSVANYASLTADIQTKKTAVQTALTTAQNDETGFSCTSGDPKGQMTQFRQDMQAVKEALKDYRISIKNLIVAVHSVTGTGQENKEATKSGNE